MSKPTAAKPRISIIVACFNDGEYVRQMWRTLDEPEPVALVVVDDGSDDPASLSALEEIAADPLVRVIHQENQGPAAAMKRAVEAASTPYVFILGADDQPASGALAKLADALDENPGAAFTYGDYITFGRFFGYRALPRWDAWLNTQGNHCSAMIMIRRDAYLEVGGNQTRSRFEDWDLLLSLIDHGRKGLKVDCVAFFYRLHDRRAQRRFSQSRSSWRREYELLQEWHPETYARLGELEKQSELSRGQRLVHKALRLLRSRGPSFLVEPLLELLLRITRITHREQIAWARRVLEQRGAI